MLDLTPALAERALAHFNAPERVHAWRQLLDSEAFQTHVAYEQQAYDTTGSEWHREARALVDGWLRELGSELAYGDDRLSGTSLLGRWLSCEDAFALTKPGGLRLDPWVTEHTGRRPFTAVRVAATVFFMSGKGKARFQMRPWVASTRYDETRDPLMSLPYQRKYDDERHGRADLILRDRAERLHVAYDLLTVLGERLEDLDVADRFVWPETKDITAELEQLGLCLSGGLGFGPLMIELCTFERGRPGEKGQLGHILEEGRYRGALGGYHRRLSGALRPSPSAQSTKWMLTQSLNELHERLSELCYDADTLMRLNETDDSQ